MWVRQLVYGLTSHKLCYGKLVGEIPTSFFF